MINWGGWFQYVREDIETYHDPDLVVFRRTNVYPDGHHVSISERRNCNSLDMAWDGYINECFSYGGHSVCVTNKVYKSKIIQKTGVRFDEELKLSEDLAYNLLYIPECKSFVEDFRIEYLRYLTDGSLTRKKLDDYYGTETRALHLFKESCPDLYEKIKIFAAHSMTNAAMNSMGRLAMGVDGDDFIHRIQRIKELMNVDEIRQCINMIDSDRESRVFLNQVKLVVQRKVYRFFLVYGIGIKIKKTLRRIVKRR